MLKRATRRHRVQGFVYQTARTLKYLEQGLGVIAGDVPLGERRGRAPRYSLNANKVREAIAALQARLLD